MSKRQFALTVLAYLTGWVIAQSIFLRVVKYVMREQRDEDFAKMADDVGRHIAPHVATRTVALSIMAGPGSTERIRRQAREMSDELYDELYRSIMPGADKVEIVGGTTIPLTINRDQLRVAVAEVLGA